MTKVIQLPTCRILVVNVPKYNGSSYEITKGGALIVNLNFGGFKLIALPEGQWQILDKPEVGRDKKFDAFETSTKSMIWHKEWHERWKLWNEVQLALQSNSISGNPLLLIEKI